MARTIGTPAASIKIANGQLTAPDSANRTKGVSVADAIAPNTTSFII